MIGLEARPANVEGDGEVTVRDLVRNALRMRPDRIVVGEVRGGEALDMLQAMNTGHDGSLSTAHANSARHLLWRLETMALMSDVDLPAAYVRAQVASAVDVVVQMTRLRDGRRVVFQIASVEGLGDDGEPVVTELFGFRPRLGPGGCLRRHRRRAGLRTGARRSRPGGPRGMVRRGHRRRRGRAVVIALMAAVCAATAALLLGSAFSGNARAPAMASLVPPEPPGPRGTRGSRHGLSSRAKVGAGAVSAGCSGPSSQGRRA